MTRTVVEENKAALMAKREKEEEKTSDSSGFRTPLKASH